MNDYEELMSLYKKIDQLVKCNDIEKLYVGYRMWFYECQIFLTKKYGRDSKEFQCFYNIIRLHTGKNEEISIPDLKSNLMLIKNVFKSFLEAMMEERNNMKIPNVNSDSINKKSRNVFIVHGHDDGLKYKVKDLLVTLGFHPIILHEQADMSRTIIEKIEQCGCQANAAIILFTPDDVGKAKHEDQLRFRGRQNVVLEAGYFIGLLGRKNTILVKSDDNIEFPGDLGGIVYNNGADNLKIAMELKAMGFDVDFNKLAQV